MAQNRRMKANDVPSCADNSNTSVSAGRVSSENNVRSVVRALSIFDAFNLEHTSLSLQEIGERIGMPKATTFRLVNTVCNSGFLVRTSDHRYGLSPKIARLGTFVRSNLGIRDVALPVMTEISRVTRETVTLNVVAGNHRLCVEVVDTPAPLMTIVKPGEHVPLLYGATGRIMLAFMDESERNAILESLDVPESERRALERELKRFRAQGYSLTRNQRIQGVSAIAVPVFDPTNSNRYCLALTGPSVRIDPNDSHYIELMMNAGREISRLLGSTEGAVAEPDAPVAAKAKASTAKRSSVRKV